MIPLQQILSKSNFSEYTATTEYPLFYSLKEENVNVATDILMPSHFFSSSFHLGISSFLTFESVKETLPFHLHHIIMGEFCLLLWDKIHTIKISQFANGLSLYRFLSMLPHTRDLK